MKKKLTLLILFFSVLFLTGWTFGLRRMNLEGKIAFIGFRHSIQIMDLSTGKCKKVPIERKARHAVLSPDGKKVAYASGRLWVGNIDGTNHRKLTNKGNAWRPAWSPDGKKIAFDGNRWLIDKVIIGTYVVNADSTNEILVTKESTQFDWSPDGKLIVFCSRGKISDIDRNTYQVVRLPFPGQSLNPALSPDGKRVVFSHGYCGANIYIMNRDGSNLKQLTFLSPKSQYMCSDPRWTPDGKKIIYAKGPLEFSFVPLRTFLYIMNHDGSNKRKLKQIPQYGG